MNAYFDLARFGRLLRAHWAESWRAYAWFAGAAVMIDLIFIAIFLSGESSTSYKSFQFDGQVAWYTIGIFAAGIIFAGRHFKNLVNPGSALIALMRPASTLEKWLLAFFCVSVFFPLAYTLLYSALNFPAVQLAKALSAAATCANCTKPSAAEFHFYVPLLTEPIKNISDDVSQSFLKHQLFVMLVLWTMQALVLGGTAYFKRSPVLKTMLTLFLLMVVLLWIGITPKTGIFWSQPDDTAVTHSMIEYGLSLGTWLGLPLLLWVAVFFHLKEREVS